jgi:hypothetical protein
MRVLGVVRGVSGLSGNWVGVKMLRIRRLKPATTEEPTGRRVGGCGLQRLERSVFGDLRSIDVRGQEAGAQRQGGSKRCAGGNLCPLLVW